GHAGSSPQRYVRILLGTFRLHEDGIRGIQIHCRPLMKIQRRITPFLWFDDRAEEAAQFYTGVFDNSRITAISRYGEAGKEQHGRKPGSVMTVDFELDGQPFTALNGGPTYSFSPAVSFVVHCETQEEVDLFWEKLSAGGKEIQCGWLEDRF